MIEILRFLCSAGAVAVLVYVAATDLRTRRIPNVVIFPAIVAAFVALPLTVGFRSGLLGAVIAPLPLILARLLLGGNKMGMGDIKLALFVGLVLGWQLAILGLLAGLVLSLLGAAAGVMMRKRTWSSKQAFAPYFAAGAIPFLLVLPFTL